MRKKWGFLFSSYIKPSSQGKIWHWTYRYHSFLTFPIHISRLPDCLPNQLFAFCFYFVGLHIYLADFVTELFSFSFGVAVGVVSSIILRIVRLILFVFAVFRWCCSIPVLLLYSFDLSTWLFQWVDSVMLSLLDMLFYFWAAFMIAVFRVLYFDIFTKSDFWLMWIDSKKFVNCNLFVLPFILYQRI